MQIKYFQTAWNDIKNSPGWFGKLCLLALVSLVPIFGTIVVLGYAYGWAREIAWGTHQPMPSKIISNEDGKFWRRGWFAFVLAFVFALVPYIVMGLGTFVQDASYYGNAADPASGAVGVFGSLIYWVGALGVLAAGVFAWIGNMRTSIYDRLSAGFQFGKLGKMFHHDANGIVRIFGMQILLGFIVGIVLSIVMGILFTIALLFGVSNMMGAGYSLESVQHMTDAQAIRFLIQFMGATGVVGIVSMLISIFLYALGTLWIDMVVIRAVGYWTMQFNVPQWRGQDDPMPFELAANPAMSAQPAAAPTQQAYGGMSGYRDASQPYGQPGGGWGMPPAGQQPGAQQTGGGFAVPAVAPYVQQPVAQQPAFEQQPTAQQAPYDWQPSIQDQQDSQMHGAEEDYASQEPTISFDEAEGEAQAETPFGATQAVQPAYEHAADFSCEPTKSVIEEANAAVNAAFGQDDAASEADAGDDPFASRAERE